MIKEPKQQFKEIPALNDDTLSENRTVKTQLKTCPSQRVFDNNTKDIGRQIPYSVSLEEISDHKTFITPLEDRQKKIVNALQNSKPSRPLPTINHKGLAQL